MGEGDSRLRDERRTCASRRYHNRYKRRRVLPQGEIGGSVKKLITWLIVMFGASLPALAQTPIDVTTVRFWDAPSGTDRCRMNVISGTPSGGNTCDHIIDYATGDLWHKVSGTWVKVADLPINLAADVGTSITPVANGGTGKNDLGLHYVLISNATSAINGLYCLDHQGVFGV